MKRRTIISAVAVALAAACVAMAVVKALRPSAPAGLPTGGHFLAVVYLYGSQKCDECGRLRDWSRQLVEDRSRLGLPDDLRWYELDRGGPQGRELATTAKVVSNAVVIAEFRDGQCLRSRCVDRLWDLTNDRAAFDAELARAIKEFAPGAPRPGLSESRPANGA